MKLSIIALALASLLPLSAEASELSYNYAELAYAGISIDDADIDADPNGYMFKGSVALGAQFYLFGSYLSGSDSIEGLDLDYDQSQFGLGFHHAINDKADLIAELSYVDASIDVEDFGSVSADGYRGSFGVRGLMAPNFEGYAKANYTDGGDVDGDFSGTIGGQYKFNATWGITAEAEFGNDATVYGIGVRASF